MQGYKGATISFCIIDDVTFIGLLLKNEIKGTSINLKKKFLEHVLPCN